MAVARSKHKQGLGITTAKSGIIYTGGQILSSLVTLAMLIYVARVLQPGDFGVYAIIVAFYTVLGVSGNLGMGTAMRRELSKAKGGERLSEIITNGYAVSMSMGLVIVIVGILASGYIASNVYGLSYITKYLQLASVMAFFVVLFNVTLSMLVGLGRVWEAGVTNIVYSLTQLIGVVIFLGMGYGVVGAIMGLAAGLVLGALAEMAYLFKSIRYRFTMPTIKMVKELTAFSIPIAISGLVTQGVSNFSVLLLGAYVATAVVGNYNAAFKVARLVEIIFASNSFILLPAFASALSHKSLSKKIGSLYNDSIFFTLLILLPVIMYLASVSTPLMNLLFSTTYASAPFYFSIIVIGMALGIIWNYAGTLIISYGDSKRFMLYELIGVALQIVLMLVLVSRFGAIGMIAALFIISPIALDYIYARALRQQFGLSHQFNQVLRIWAASLILLGVLYGISVFLQNSPVVLITNAMIALALYPPLLALIGGVGKDRVEALRSFNASHRLGGMLNGLVDYLELFIRR